jgi:hypothetical protein
MDQQHESLYEQKKKMSKINMKQLFNNLPKYKKCKVMQTIAKTLSTSSAESLHANLNGIINKIVKHEVKNKNFVGLPTRILKYSLYFSV